MGAAVCWLGAGAGYLVAEAVVAAAFRDHYSYTYDYISDLGRAVDSPLAHLMNFAFCLQGTGFLVGAVLAGRAVGGRNVGLFFTLATANVRWAKYRADEVVDVIKTLRAGGAVVGDRDGELAAEAGEPTVMSALDA